MTQACRCCSSPHRKAIDAAIVARTSVRDIAGRYNVSKSSVQEHKSHARAKVEQANLDEGRTLAGLMRELHGHAVDIFEGATDDDIRIKALKERRELAALEFGTKSKTEVTTRQPVPASPAEEIEQLAELKRDIADRERELKAGMQ